MSHTLTVLDGGQDIGGTKLLLSGPEGRLLLDFGMNFAQRNQFYGDYMGPRSVRGYHDLVSLGLLPSAPSWYREDLRPRGVRPLEPARFEDGELCPDAVLLTHAHLDHAGYLSFLKSHVPVYATIETALVLKAMQDTGATDMEREYVYLVPREQKDELIRATHYQRSTAVGRPYHVFIGNPLAEAPALLARKRAFWHETPSSRPLEAAELDCIEHVPGETHWSFRAAGYEVLAFPVDHSIPGACAYCVRLPEGWLVYTGDLRMHGHHGQATRRFMQWLTAHDVVMLVVEGTTTGVQWPASEAAVYDNALQAMQWSDGVAIADFGARNVERLATFLAVTRAVGRKLVLTARDAYLLEALHGVVDGCPDPLTAADVLVYGTARINRRIWERLLLERLGGGIDKGGRVITVEDVDNDPSGLVLAFGYYDLNELLDSSRSLVQGTYVYSSSEAHDEESALDLARLFHWIAHFGLQPVGLADPNRRRRNARGEQSGALHVSGHMHGPGLVELVHAANAQKLVPVHTHDRTFFKKNAPSGTRVVYPQREAAIPVS